MTGPERWAKSCLTRTAQFRLRSTSTHSGLAWVLGGGAAKGAVHVGATRALLEAGIKPSAIIGTSVGALDGGVIACSPTLEGADLLRDLWLSEPAHEVFHFHLLGAMRATTFRHFGISVFKADSEAHREVRGDHRVHNFRGSPSSTIGGRNRP